MKKRNAALALILVTNGLILLLAYLVRQSVVDTWYKGPLIDPAAPYAPENAQVFFAVGMCTVLNLYFVFLYAGRSLRRSLWFPVVSLLLSIGITEVGISGYLQYNQSTYFRPHPTLHWVCRSNLQDFQNQTGGGLLNTNAHGMREVTEPYEKPAGQFRILVLGDSSNFGHGVSGDDMWSSQLEDLLNDVSAAEIKVLNAACPGWTTWQGVEVVQSYGQKYEPDLIIAGFNNDAGSDFFTDRDRVSDSEWVRLMNGVLFQSELYLLSREAVLSIARKFSPTAQEAYSLRLAGEKNKYGQVNSEAYSLTPRVPLPELKENLRTLNGLSQEQGGTFLWINMPINRRTGQFVDSYVRWDFRDGVAQQVAEENIQYIDVDDYWQRTREDNLHIPEHVFHPNAVGHQRMAEQIARHVLEEGLIPEVLREVEVNGPPPAQNSEVLRFGWSSKTPIHSHVGLVLEEHPELAEKYGLQIELHHYASGKDQGRDLAEGKLDAWLSCAVPAIHMLDSRPDAKVVASPGFLGRIAILARQDISSLEELKGKTIGLSKGSTPDMVWRNHWLKEIGGARDVDVPTEDLAEGLLSGTVDAIVSWDPWVERFLVEHPEWNIVAEQRFRSVLIVGKLWAIGGGTEDPRAKRLVQMLEEALEIAAENRTYYDQKAARMGDWPVEVVETVADQNRQLSGLQKDIALTVDDRKRLQESMRFVDPKRAHAGILFGEYLLDGVLPVHGER